MICTKEQLAKFEELARPLMKFLADEFHPHVQINLTSTNATIMEESAGIHTEDYIPD